MGSSRVKDTEAAGSASALREMKTRPLLVAAHSVEVSDEARATAVTAPPNRGSSGEAFAVSLGPPSGTQSPQVTPRGKSPVHSLQCSRSSASVILPWPAVLVRHTCSVPTNSVLLTLGWEIIGT